MGMIIEITEDKMHNLSENIEKGLRYVGKAMQCLDDLQHEGGKMGMRDDYDDMDSRMGMRHNYGRMGRRDDGYNRRDMPYRDPFYY